MKKLISFILTMFITNAAIASAGSWQKFQTNKNSLPDFLNVRLGAPSGMGCPNYPILAIFTWEIGKLSDDYSSETDVFDQIQA